MNNRELPRNGVGKGSMLGASLSCRSEGLPLPDASSGPDLATLGEDWACMGDAGPACRADGFDFAHHKLSNQVGRGQPFPFWFDRSAPTLGA